MEILLSGLILVSVVLLVLALAVPGLAVVLVLAFPVWAILLLARAIRSPARGAQLAVASPTRITLGGARTGSVGIPNRLLPRTADPRYRSRPQNRSRPEGVVAPSRRNASDHPRALPWEFQSGEAFLAFDRNLTVVSWNEVAAEMTGVTAEKALGRPCWELLGGIDVSGDLVCHAGCPGACLAGQESPVKGKRLLIKTATGARRAVWISTIAVTEGDQSLTLHLLRDAA